MNILENFLDKIQSNDLERFLSNFPEKVVFDDNNSVITGLLKYRSISNKTAYLFKMPKEQVQIFHTMNMKFSIGIAFFNKNGKLVKKYNKCKPNIKEINSEKPASFVVEFLPKGD